MLDTTTIVRNHKTLCKGLGFRVQFEATSATHGPTCDGHEAQAQGCRCLSTAHRHAQSDSHLLLQLRIWVVVKSMVPSWVLIILRHLIFRVPKKGP